jgi:catechol 2,3-dioxygenase-like lactoylglutathione lyase family enzyme
MPCCPTQSASRASTSAAQPISAPKVHLHIAASDFDAAVDFYRRFFGTEPIKLKPGYAKFLPEWAPVNLAISEHAVDGVGAINHVGIQLPDPEAVQKHLNRMHLAGLASRVEMGVDCCHANQDKFWVVDPSGIEWEVYHLNFDIEGAVSTKASSACCAR